MVSIPLIHNCIIYRIKPGWELRNRIGHWRSLWPPGCRCLDSEEPAHYTAEICVIPWRERSESGSKPMDSAV